MAHSSNNIVSSVLFTTAFAGVLLQLLFAVTTTTALPLNQDNQDNQDNTEQEITSKLVSGLTAGTIYVGKYAKQNDIEAPFSFAANDSDLTAVIQDLCNLTAYYELVNRVAESGEQEESVANLQALLKENVQDACQWVKSKSSNDSEADKCCDAEMKYFQEQCSIMALYTNRLHYSALLMARAAYPASASPLDWVTCATTIPEEQKERILEVLSMQS